MSGEVYVPGRADVVGLTMIARRRKDGAVMMDSGHIFEDGWPPEVQYGIVRLSLSEIWDAERGHSETFTLQYARYA